MSKSHRSSIKKTLGGALIFISIFSFLPLNVSAVYGGASNPFPIKNMEDLYRVVECMRVNKNWSNGKHFSLQASLELKKSISLASNSSEEHQFNGHFHGNGHTITLTSDDSLFGHIGEHGVVENLTIVGKGNFARQNAGVIKDCTTTSEASCGVTSTNSGSILNCKIDGKYSSSGITDTNSGSILNCKINGQCDSSGITSNNTGKITNCVVEGNVSGYQTAGLANHNHGTITNCRMKAHIKHPGGNNSYSAGLTLQNQRIIENCTMNGILEGDSTVYLVQSSWGKDASVKRCVAGKDAKGATDEHLFGGANDTASECGYEEWDQIDHCTV